MPLGFIADLSANASVLLILSLAAVCFFEAINGFHDTANAVATVIYTKTLPPVFAVIWSGFFNFLGAFLGGVAVAMGILKLMPLNDMMAVSSGESIALVLAIVISSIAWNLGTWYLGIPCSSSHSLIGSLLGGGFAFWTIHKGAGPNWEKAGDIGLSLLISPLFGFSLAILLMFVLRSTVKKRKQIFNEPDAKKAPPTWIRAIMITTCTLVSYFHGSNDGQKGVGLLMVVLIAFMPARFALNSNLPISELSASVRKIETAISSQAATDFDHGDHLKIVAANAHALGAQLDTTHFKDKKEVFAARKSVQALVKSLEIEVKNNVLTNGTHDVVKKELPTLSKSYEFSPFWVILMISICLGIGTMVGWKRIVVTIGEKIGKTHLSYAQGASAELCAAATIGVSSAFGLPVSTTHVLSSGIAGTMVAQGGVQNLRKKTIVNIAIAWVLTLPVTMVMSMLLFYLFRLFA